METDDIDNKLKAAREASAARIGSDRRELASDKPGVKMASGRRMALRFAIPEIVLSPDEVANLERIVEFSSADLLEHVRSVDVEFVDSIRGLTPPGALVLHGAHEKRASSIVSGMLLFLSRLAQASAPRVCYSPPISRGMILSWRNRYELFDALCSEMEGELADVAEDELYHRAVHGTDKAMVVNGSIQYVNQKSDDLLKFYMTHNKKKYNQKSEVDLKVNGAMMANVAGLDNEQMMQLLAMLGGK